MPRGVRALRLVGFTTVSGHLSCVGVDGHWPTTVAPVATDMFHRCSDRTVPAQAAPRCRSLLQVARLAALGVAAPATVASRIVDSSTPRCRVGRLMHPTPQSGPRQIGAIGGVAATQPTEHPTHAFLGGTRLPRRPSTAVYRYYSIRWHSGVAAPGRGNSCRPRP